MSSAPSTLIHSARLITDGTDTPSAWVRIEDGYVTATGTGSDWADAAEVIDAASVAGEGAILTPGFIDVHCHGGAGFAFDDGADAIRAARVMHRSHGTTRSVISLVTAPVDDLVQSVRTIADLMRTDVDILGSHLEGPFLNAEFKGAHEPTLLTDPAADAIARLLDAGAGTIRQITLAPELAGGLDAIRTVTAHGVTAAVGHSSADADMARAAFDAGATLLTHAFNGMRGIHHRAPGPVIAAAHDPRVTLEAIVDDVHLDPHISAMLFQLAPGRVALVTDAMAAAGSADGHYDLGAVSVTVRDGIARTDATGSIAGSTLTQDAALRRAIAAGVSITDAVTALTATPAASIGVHTAVGSLKAGYLADWVLLDARLNVARVATAAHPTA